MRLLCNNRAIPTITYTPSIMDTMTKEQRHNCMASIRGKNTKPEIMVRKFLFSRGFRYRLNHPRLPGHPDIVLRKYRTCVFVNGCFWHGHEGCRYYVIPKSNTEFWKAKIERNRNRDIEDQRKLATMGWHCITVWECQLKPAVRERTLESLAFTLNRIFLNDHSIRRYELPEEDCAVAAEPRFWSTATRLSGPARWKSWMPPLRFWKAASSPRAPRS